MSTRVVLIGGNGFVGSHLKRALGPGNVIAPPRAEADLTRTETLREIIQAGDCVINAAGYANATDTSAAGRARFRQLNVDGVASLLRIVEEAPAAHLIHLSSVAAMGRWHGTENVTEDMIRPDHQPYAASKREGEILLENAKGTVPITILRPTSVLGEGRGLARLLCAAISRGVAPLPAGGQAMLPLTYVGNIVHAIQLSMLNPACFHRTFIVGDRQSYSLRTVVESLSNALGASPRLVGIPMPLARYGARIMELCAGLRASPPVFDRWRLENLSSSVSYSTAAFESATGYTPPFSLEAAMERIAGWYLSLSERRSDGSQRISA